MKRRWGWEEGRREAQVASGRVELSKGMLAGWMTSFKDGAAQAGLVIDRARHCQWAAEAGYSASPAGQIGSVSRTREERARVKQMRE